MGAAAAVAVADAVEGRSCRSHSGSWTGLKAKETRFNIDIHINCRVYLQHEVKIIKNVQMFNDDISSVFFFMMYILVIFTSSSHGGEERVVFLSIDL